MILPQQLEKGDTVMIISPAGKIAPRMVDDMVSVLKDWGLRPIVAPHALSEKGRYSSSEGNRLSDFNLALRDPEVKAIFCSRGGYGAVHLLGKLSPEEIRTNPKWLVGFSDITLLHALYSKAGVISLHGPMAKGVGQSGDEFSKRMLKEFLFGQAPTYCFGGNAMNRSGAASGRVAGGNLAVMCGLRATPYDFDYEGAILFIEDIGESPYKVERMLYNLKLSGVFERIAALVVGEFTDCGDDSGTEESVYEKIRRLTEEYDFPVCYGFPLGHGEDNVPLPEGMTAQIEVTRETVRIQFVK